MNLLDRHIFKSVLFTCLAAVGLFTFVFALGNVVKELLGPFLAGQLELMTMVRLVLLLLPFAVCYALPMGILTGVLLTLGRLSADSEITAMRAAGMSVVRVARPVFILAFVGMATALYANFESMPWARVQYHRELAEAVRANPMSFLVPKTFIRDFKGSVVYIGDRAPGSSVLKDVWVWKLDKESRTESFVHAESGRIDYDHAKQSFVITLIKPVLEERDHVDPENVVTKAPRVQKLNQLQETRVSLERYLGQNIFHVKDEWLRLGAYEEKRIELEAKQPEPGKEKELSVARMKLTMILHDKLNTSLAVFMFAFIAVPLGIKVSRRETSANLGVAVALVLGYYLLVSAVKNLDRHPEYRPDLLLWVPNLILFSLGTWLVRRVER